MYIFNFIVFILLLSALIPINGDDNGRAITPPLGWRSWNYYQCNINQKLMTANFMALADRSRKVDGVYTSLVDLGYVDAGLDDCWQLCGKYGPMNYTYHNADGVPQVNTDRFPSMLSMTQLAHSMGLRAGFYSNNCACADHCPDDKCFTQDVAATLSFGFDSIKLDGCGQERNVAKWRDLFNKTSQKPIMIENCHNGPNQPVGKDPAQCPFHMYRSSDDIAPCFGSILSNLQTIVPLATAGLSYPGCWAYPDMLEVAQTNSQGRMPLLTAIESRSHFSAWAIVSSPLILGFDLTNSTAMDMAWPIITNKEVIQVNQQWAGFSGSIFNSSTEKTTFNPCSWSYNSCTLPSTQYLYKPQPGNKMAILLMNNAETTNDLMVNFSSIPGLTKSNSYTIRDLWLKQNLGSFTDSYTAKGVPSRDSVFLVLTPN